MNVTIDDAAVKRMLDRLESATAMKAGLRSMAGYLRGKMSVYPPQRGQRYRRTGNLAKRWGQVEEAGGLVQIVGNDAEYAPRVVGFESQKPIFKHYGWQTTADVVEAESEAAFKTFVAGFRQSMTAR